MDEISKLLTAMRSSLDEDILLAGGIIKDGVQPVNDKEWQYVVSASPKRQQEFSCGRLYAHRLLDQVGFTDFVIGRDSQGCPQWPDGVVGSISHTSDFCVALLAKSIRYTSLGIDLELSGRLKASLWPRLFARSEIRQLEQISDAARRMRHAAIIFSAKEAFYKCDYPLNHRCYEFTDAEVALDETTRCLQLSISRDGGRVEYGGCYAAGMTHVMTAIVSSR
ncbi:MAG: 4'-phosphopantetheinyl transferase superfamily protein [Gammaproteobacteria bacterium]|nr:4'-phosphopantetheinyl transferase superfamily protein [Gammaproteobacteria bacterium]